MGRRQKCQTFLDPFFLNSCFLMFDANHGLSISLSLAGWLSKKFRQFFTAFSLQQWEQTFPNPECFVIWGHFLLFFVALAGSRFMPFERVLCPSRSQPPTFSVDEKSHSYGESLALPAGNTALEKELSTSFCTQP